MKNLIKEKIKLFKYSVFHPFDGFYEIRFRHKGSLGIALLMMILYGILNCFSFQYTGFIMNHKPVHEMNSIITFVSTIMLIVLFTVSNWTITTLFNGKGRLADIFIVVCYSLVPIIIVNTAAVIISNFIIEEEIMILQAVQGMAVVWFIFMIVAGLCTIHEYTFLDNIGAIIATFISAVIIIFIGILFFTMIEQMLSFAVSIIEEFIRRL